MKVYARFKEFNIAFDEIMQKFFITSKAETMDRPMIGGFDTACDAILFANSRVS